MASTEQHRTQEEEASMSILAGAARKRAAPRLAFVGTSERFSVGLEMDFVLFLRYILNSKIELSHEATSECQVTLLLDFISYPLESSYFHIVHFHKESLQ